MLQVKLLLRRLLCELLLMLRLPHSRLLLRFRQVRLLLRRLLCELPLMLLRLR